MLHGFIQDNMMDVTCEVGNAHSSRAPDEWFMLFLFLFTDFANVWTSVLLVKDCFGIDWFYCWCMYIGMRLVNVLVILLAQIHTFCPWSWVVWGNARHSVRLNLNHGGRKGKTIQMFPVYDETNIYVISKAWNLQQGLVQY